jgi:hypothetical protein
MNIKVFSRENCLKYVKENKNNNRAIISITDIKSQLPFKLTKESAVLFLQFDDEECGDRAMTQQHANTIVSFIKSLNGKIDELIVHCEAGVSRSAAVAAAISFSINGDDAEFFKFPYYPNRLCYRLVLEAFGFDLKNLFLDQKYEDNIQDIIKHIDEL